MQTLRKLRHLLWLNLLVVLEPVRQLQNHQQFIGAQPAALSALECKAQIFLLEQPSSISLRFAESSISQLSFAPQLTPWRYYYNSSRSNLSFPFCSFVSKKGSFRAQSQLQLIEGLCQSCDESRGPLTSLEKPLCIHFCLDVYTSARRFGASLPKDQILLAQAQPRYRLTACSVYERRQFAVLCFSFESLGTKREPCF